MRKNFAVYRITKLKRVENFILWVEKLKFCFILFQLWFYIFEIEKESFSSVKSNLRKKNDIERAMIKTKQTIYDAEYKQYKKNHKKWIIAHNKICAAMHISFKQRFRSHVKNMKNDTKVFLKFKSFYETIDLITIDFAVKKICSKSFVDFKNVDDWTKHLKKWKNEINAIDENLFVWFMSSRFRMSLTRNLNSYMFHFIHEVKLRETILIIDEMIKTLIDQNKRNIHMKESRDSVRAIKNSRNRSIKFSKNDESKDKNKSKKNRDIDSCEMCEFFTHDKSHCFYHNKFQRIFDWKFYEIKMHLIVNWSNKINFVSVNKIDKVKKNDKIKRVKFDDFIVFAFKSDFSIENSIFSDFENNTFSITSFRHSAMNRIKRIRFNNFIFQINCATRIAKSTISFKDSNFFLDSETNTHLCYNKKLFHELKSFATIKIVEIVDNALLTIKKIEFIIFELNIDDKRVCNIIIDVEYVSDFEFNFISIDTFEKKSCEIVVKQNRFKIIDENDDKIFMIDTRQKKKFIYFRYVKICHSNTICENFYFLKSMTSSIWTFQFSRCQKICNNEFHRRLRVFQTRKNRFTAR